MREVVIRMWCDAHGRGTEATRTTPPVQGKVLDLCDECYRVIVVPWLDLVLQHGVEPEPEPPRKRTAATTEACPVCGDPFKGRRNVAAHLRTEHNRSIREFTAKKGAPLAEPPAPTTHLRSTA